MEAANSLGIRHNGELVGWVITQPREPNAICYACSYMRPNLQRRGHLVAAYAEAVRRQIEFTDKPIGIWIVPYIQGPMAAFVLRRMKPYLISLSEFKEANKVFTPVHAPGPSDRRRGHHLPRAHRRHRPGQRAGAAASGLQHVPHRHGAEGGAQSTEPAKHIIRRMGETHHNPSHQSCKVVRQRPRLQPRTPACAARPMTVKASNNAPATSPALRLPTNG